MSARTPTISVVVATHNRAGRLERLAEALRAQEGAGEFEVVIVDDGSSDTTPAVVQRIEESWPTVRSLRLERNRGPASARNVGWRAARAPIVAFTDDDCVPQPGWLAALVAASTNADVVQGRTIGNPTQALEGWFAWSPEVTSADGFYETCNIAYRRSVLARVGGFDERFRSLRSRARERGEYVAPTWGEDTDLALRALGAGAQTAFAADAIVWHDVKPGGLLDRLQDLPRRGGVVGAVKRHPELRGTFHSRWFSQRGHLYVLVAVVGVGVCVARPWDPRGWVVGAALASPWARERGRHYPHRAWPRVLPQWLLVDLVDVGIMAAASVRERTLFL